MSSVELFLSTTLHYCYVCRLVRITYTGVGAHAIFAFVIFKDFCAVRYTRTFSSACDSLKCIPCATVFVDFTRIAYTRVVSCSWLAFQILPLVRDRVGAPEDWTWRIICEVARVTLLLFIFIIIIIIIIAPHPSQYYLYARGAISFELYVKHRVNSVILHCCHPGT